MILTVEEFRRLYQTEETDEAIQFKLDAIEQMILNYTHNDFRKYMVDGVVQYPADVKRGAINLLLWDLDHRDKVGIQSESLSRHSVTYFNLDGTNSEAGYPRAMLGFLKPYKRARFGQGLSV